MKHSELRHQPRHVNPRIQVTSNPIKYKKQLHPLIYTASETAPVSSL